ncbi:MAG: 2-succinyl-5-enolpyruvyl-6-hydroxy-3-cyclohexene-1-carboxylic-acid synthase [bacterium]|nr:2-succinyl-5-enolpyruvyl-6-hydroxy-3-cyclohexene-1-carboxylic-acid synthase [bacterium]
MAARLVSSYGICKVFASPGSRNTPLLLALEAEHDVDVEMVVDERSAAFMALGYARRSLNPVAVCCTSGSALLNYLPAISEAFYDGERIVVLSADRPEPWIDQDDSQTIHQRGALEPYVLDSVDIPDLEFASEDDAWRAERDMICALDDCCLSAAGGPVHINLRFDNPLGKTIPLHEAPRPRKVDVVRPLPALPTAEARALGASIASPEKVLVVAGFMHPSQKLNKAITRLAALPNFALIAEPEANLHCPKVINEVDTVLGSLDDDLRRRLAPDVVISLGGALVSRHLKTFIRSLHPRRHWHVGVTHTLVDCFKALTTRIDMPPELFMPQLASAMQPHRAPSDYAALWQRARSHASLRRKVFLRGAPWCALTAMDGIVSSLPQRADIQVSNGTSVRYLQLQDTSHLRLVSANRGVSGIDGSTSAAVGAQLAALHNPTVLITGDMSLQYDLTALGTSQVTPRFKVIVMDNGGGGIFRFIPSTAYIPGRDKLCVAPKPFPIEALADAWGFRVWRAETFGELDNGLKEFFAWNGSPAMLVVKTDGQMDADILHLYFDSLKHPYIETS